MSGRFDYFVVSVDSTLGGSVGRNVSLDGGGAAHLLREGDFSRWDEQRGGVEDGGVQQLHDGR